MFVICMVTSIGRLNMSVSKNGPPGPRRAWEGFAMSNRRKLRVPGRYEREPRLRGPLGDPVVEAGIRDGFTAALRVNQAGRARAGGRVQVATVEGDTGMLERVEIAEASTGGVKAVKGKPSEVTIDIIRSGWNKSGSRYYPAEVIERDVPLVYPVGTQMFINHPGQEESEDRPERSLYDLAAVFTSTPYAVREGDQVVMRSTARVFSRHREFLEEAHKDIGVSINGNGDGSITEREGRTGLVLERLTYGQSVDFVTKPGAGGRIIALMEADRPTTTLEAATIGSWLESRMHLGFTELADDLYGDGRLTRTERIAASSAVGDALAAFVAKVEAAAPALYQRDRWGYPPEADAETREAITVEAAVEQQRAAIEQAVHAEHRGDKRYAWVRDFDPDAGLVWFEAGDHDTAPRLWQQAYTRTGPVAVLAGEPVEVRSRTVYDPVAPVATTESTGGTPPPDVSDGPDSAPATTTTKENDMADKSPEVVAREAAETRLAQETRTREAAETELARYRAGDTARPIVEQLLAESDLPDLARARVRAEYGTPAALPLLESTRGLDETSLRGRVAASISAEKTYVAGLLESAGVGRVTGNGAAAGAGAGMPAGYAPAGAQAGGQPTSFFGLSRSASVQLSEAERAQANEQREATIRVFESRGLSRKAAELAADR